MKWWELLEFQKYFFVSTSNEIIPSPIFSQGNFWYLNWAARCIAKLMENMCDWIFAHWNCFFLFIYNQLAHSFSQLSAKIFSFFRSQLSLKRSEEFVVWCEIRISFFTNVAPCVGLSAKIFALQNNVIKFINVNFFLFVVQQKKRQNVKRLPAAMINR